MLNRSILVKNSLEETEQILKELIPTINGKIKNISDEEYSIEWTYLYGLQTIFCETKLIPNKNGIEIFSIADSDDIYKTGAKKALENLYVALSQTHNLEYQKNEEKHKSQKTFQSTNPTSYKPFIIAGIILLLIISYFNSKDSKTSNTRTTKYGYYAAYNEETLKKAIRFYNQQDSEAFNLLIMYGEIFKIPEGEEIHLLDQTFSGIVKIRIRGTTEEIWTIREALNN